jgi:signal transduction histidine kinase
MTQADFDAEQARRDLYEVMKQDNPFQAKATEALELGRRYLDVANGHLTEIESASDYRKVLASTDPPDGVLTPGLVLDLQKTFCRETIKRDSPLSIHDATEQGFEGHPAAAMYGINCYHGTTITIDGEVYGTVCFGSLSPRDEPFTDDETLYAELIGRMLEHEINRDRTDDEIDRLDRFASVVSHDLRNPMAVARSRIELEREERDSENLAAAATAIDRMDDLIDDVLTVARQGREVDDTNTISLETVVECCRQTVDTSAATITVADEFEFQADSDRLQQLLENLFRNAIEHGSTSADAAIQEEAVTSGGSTTETDAADDRAPTAEGTVSITVGSLDAGNGFFVEDDGPGIPEAERDEVFESGYSTASEGTGLGLSIVESIADAHDWAVSVTESAESSGARFEVADVVTQP